VNCEDSYDLSFVNQWRNRIFRRIKDAEESLCPSLAAGEPGGEQEAVAQGSGSLKWPAPESLAGLSKRQKTTARHNTEYPFKCLLCHLGWHRLTIMAFHHLVQDHQEDEQFAKARCAISFG
jgi:hypothetical protein